MTICIESYENKEGIIAEICFNKYERNPYITICEPIEKPLYRTIYTNYYSSVQNAKRAIKAFAKRNGFSEFIKTNC